MARIALVTHSVDGGVWRLTRFLRQVIVDDGEFEPSVILLATSSTDDLSTRLTRPRSWLAGPRVGVVERDGIPVRRVGARWTEIEWQRYRPRRVLRSLLADADIVQVVSGSPAWLTAVADCERPVFLYAATLVDSERRSVIGRASGLERLRRRVATRGTAFLEQRALRRADAVFVLNSWMYQHVAARIGEARTELAIPGIDTGFWSPADGAGPVPKTHILYMGRLADPRKNLDMLLDAYRRADWGPGQMPGLVLAGRGSLPASLQARIDGWDGPVRPRVMSHPGDAELVALCRSAYCLALSSDEEGLGIVLLEAMSAGLPVVTTDCGGPRSVVEHGVTGLLTPVGDAVEFGRALVRVCTDRTAAEAMGRRAREVIVSRYSMLKSGEAFLARYRACLRRPG